MGMMTYGDAVEAMAVIPQSSAPTPGGGSGGMGFTDPGGFSWGDFAQWGTDLFGKIATAQWGQPQVPVGTVITTPGGQIIRQNPQYPVTPGPVTGGVNVGVQGGGATTILMMGGLALIVLVIALKK